MTIEIQLTVVAFCFASLAACSGGSGTVQLNNGSASTTSAASGAEAGTTGSEESSGTGSTGADANSGTTSGGRETVSTSTGQQTTGAQPSGTTTGGRGGTAGRGTTVSSSATTATATTGRRSGSGATGTGATSTGTSATSGSTSVGATSTSGGAGASSTGSSTGPVGSYQVKQVSGVMYGTNALDIMNYAYPVNATAPSPVMLFVHGGGWEEGGGYTFYNTAINQYAGYGLFAATIDYRDLPNYPWPAMIADVRLALRYLRTNAATLNLDPTRICVGGDSAGGQLALIAGYDHDPVQAWDVQTYTSEASDAQCVISMFGPTEGGPGGSNVPDQRALDYVNAQSVPTWITQGSVDTTVNPSQSIDLYIGLTTLGIQRAFFEYDGDHEFGGAPTTGPQSIQSAYKDQAAWVLQLFGLPYGGIETETQLQSCGQNLSTTATPALLDCFVSSP